MVHRLGFIIDFLSKATLVGFMAGAAVIVSLQQLKGLLGIVHFTSKMQIIPVLTSVFQQRHEVRLNGLLVKSGVQQQLFSFLIYTHRCPYKINNPVKPPVLRRLKLGTTRKCPGATFWKDDI